MQRSGENLDLKEKLRNCINMNPITIKATIKAPISKVWECWTKEEHVTKWNFASSDSHCQRA